MTARPERLLALLQAGHGHPGACSFHAAPYAAPSRRPLVGAEVLACPDLVRQHLQRHFLDLRKGQTLLIFLK